MCLGGKTSCVFVGGEGVAPGGWGGVEGIGEGARGYRTSVQIRSSGVRGLPRLISDPPGPELTLALESIYPRGLLVGRHQRPVIIVYNDEKSSAYRLTVLEMLC